MITSGTGTFARHAFLLGTACLATMLVSACKPTADDAGKSTPAIDAAAQTAKTEIAMTELQWARAALERNPHLKVLAVDEARHTIQVQVKATGQTLWLSPGELAALPISDFLKSDFLTQSSSAATVTEAVAAPSEAVTASAAQESSSSSSQGKYEYQVDRSQNRLRVTGPGISIESSGAPAKSASNKIAATGLPIVCAGSRLMRVDNRTLNVDGDAIFARGGCDLYITNSHITATGTAVVVQDAAVHIDNSDITGAGNSLTTNGASRLYLRHSTFSGLARRDPQAMIQDQGDNTWR